MEVIAWAELRMTICPECEWTVKSPWGENDEIDHAMLHAKKTAKK
jgi:hypothetical protein